MRRSINSALRKFNLYHASYWIINPATQGKVNRGSRVTTVTTVTTQDGGDKSCLVRAGYGLVGCSLVELIAEAWAESGIRR